MTIPINTATRWGELEVRGIRRDRPDVGKVAEVLVELARGQLGDKRSCRDDRAGIGGGSSPCQLTGQPAGSGISAACVTCTVGVAYLRG